MKIVVHESITAGGLGGSRVAPTLLAEGRMMLEALLTDLLPLEAHQLSVQVDRRYLSRLPVYPGLQVVDSGNTPYACDAPMRMKGRTLHPLPHPPPSEGEGTGGGDFRSNSYYQCLAQMVQEADAAFLVAPETGGLLEAITGMVEACGKLVLGSSTVGIKAAGDKMLTYQMLKACGIPTPRTLRLHPADDPASVGQELGYPVVVKPIDGVGCHSVFIARRQSELERTIAAARQEVRDATLVAQAYIGGVAASVSLLTDGSRSLPLTLNLQEIRGRSRLRYHGGCVPFDHPLRALAFRRTEEVVRAIPGLKGYVGIDLILTDHDAVVIDVNPRITTSYVGVRKVLRQNPAALILDAVAGKLPDPAEIQIVGSARFTTRSCNVRALRSRQ